MDTMQEWTAGRVRSVSRHDKGRQDQDGQILSGLKHLGDQHPEWLRTCNVQGLDAITEAVGRSRR